MWKKKKTVRIMIILGRGMCAKIDWKSSCGVLQNVSNPIQ